MLFGLHFGAGLSQPGLRRVQSSRDIAPVSNSSGVRIELAGGRQVLVTRGFDRQVLLEVIHALEGLPSKLEGIAPVGGAAS